jgi:hypothetical protein
MNQMAMQEDNISFEEIGKEETVHAEQSQALFKQPIRGRYQGLHEELKVKCAPENFMNPYEPKKVSKANELYSEVLHTDEQADKQLKQLRLRAIEELGIKFSTEKLFGKLSAACNPKIFTGESYNKERLELANRLYQAVMMNADNVLALEEIEGEAKELIEAYKPNKNDNEVNENRFGDVRLLKLLVVCVALYALAILISFLDNH